MANKKKKLVHIKVIVVTIELNNSHMQKKKSPNKTKQKVPKNTLAFVLRGFKLVIRSYSLIRTSTIHFSTTLTLTKLYFVPCTLRSFHSSQNIYLFPIHFILLVVFSFLLIKRYYYF